MNILHIGKQGMMEKFSATESHTPVANGKPYIKAK